MYAHIYGKKHFKHQTQFEGITLFSDAVYKTNTATKPLSTHIYIEVEKLEKPAETWFLHIPNMLSGAYGDFYLQEKTNPLGIISNFKYDDTPENTAFLQAHSEYLGLNMEIPYYIINEKYYIKIKTSLSDNDFDAIVDGLQGSSTTKPKEEVSIEYDAFVTVFVSDDGAKLERAYQKITNIHAHQIVLFIESDRGTNAFGTVFRLHKGKNIKTLPEVDRLAIAKLARDFGVGITVADISEMIQEELKDPSSAFYLYGSLRAVKKVIRWQAKEVFTDISSELKSMAKTIDDNLKLDENRWKSLIDNTANNKYNPLLPKLTKENATFDAERFSKLVYKTYLEPLVAKANKAINIVHKKRSLRKLIPFNFNRLIQVLAQIPEFLQYFFEKVAKDIVNMYNFINGLLVGLLNSIIELIKSIFDILALLFDVLNGVITLDEFFDNPASYLGLFVESFENLIDSFTALFSKENFLRLMEFITSLPVLAAQGLYNFITGEKTITLDYSALGYYFGFFIGFVASEVLTFFATGGTGTIAKALKATLQGYKTLAMLPVKVAKNTAKLAGKVVVFSLDTFLKLTKTLANFIKNIPKHLDTLKGWIDEFVKGLAKTANLWLREFKATLDLLKDLGVLIIKLDPNVAIATVGIDGTYQIKRYGEVLMEASKEILEGHLRKIDDIRKSSGGNAKKKIKHYLYELSDDLNVKHENFLKSNNLRIERPKGARSNLQIIDESEDIYFYGKSDEIDEYIRLLGRTEVEKLADYNKVIDYFRKSSAKYTKEKIWKDGSILKFSKHNKPPMSVDFSSTPQHIYGGKADKPGIVKIKLTGNDEKDFLMSFKKAGISDSLAIELNKTYTWHHVDDFDPLTGECTMQLVNRKVHEGSCPHIGGGGLYKAFMGIGYPNRKIKFKL